jgi:hypothetical protein
MTREGEGRSEWEPIKILLRRDELDYVPKSQLRIPTRACQGYVVTTDLPALGTSPNATQSKSRTQEVKDLGCLQDPGVLSTLRGRTVCGGKVDCPKLLLEPPVVHKKKRPSVIDP